MNHDERNPDEPLWATPTELTASDLVDGRAASSDPSVVALADKFRFVASAIVAPVPVDPAEMETHLATALGSTSGTTTGTTLVKLGSRRGPKLLAAAVVVAVATIGGIAVDQLVVNGSGNSTTDSSVALGPAPTGARAPKATDVVTTAPVSADGVGERDLGAFADVAALRIRLVSLPRNAAAADRGVPVTGPESKGAAQAERSAPVVSGSACPLLPGELSIATATVAGRNVVILRSDNGVDRILDKTTCGPAA